MSAALAFSIGLAALLILLVAFKMIANNKRKLDVESADPGAVKSIPDIKCPKCGAPMEDGFLSVRGFARWRGNKSSPGTLSTSGEEIENFAQEPSAFALTYGVPENIAKRCKQCALLLIDHRKLYKLTR